MKIIHLKYGNTNTYLIGSLLVDTDMAGTMPALRRALKTQGIGQETIKYVFATHYHPDHIGLIGELVQSGVKLILAENQKAFVHSSDEIFARDKHTRFVPIDERPATAVTFEESRAFLAKIGIDGEIIPTKSHSPDGAALLLDDGNAFVGDIEPRSFIEGYADNELLREDWNELIRHGARIIHFGHANAKELSKE